MRSASSLLAAALFPQCLACSCGVSIAVPDTDPPLVMLVPGMGTVAHGTIRILDEAPCMVDGETLDKGGSYREVHVGEVAVDWTIPARPYQLELPVIVSPAPAVYAIATEPTSAFFRLASFDVTGDLSEGDRACTVVCNGEALTTAYLVDTGIATDDEVAAARMTLDDAKEVLINRAAERDARGDAAVHGAEGCDFLKAP